MLFRSWKEEYAPKQPEDDWHPLFVEALHRQPYIEYLLDVYKRQVQGNPGEGKTTFALRLAAACTTGGTLPGMKPIPVSYTHLKTAGGELVKIRRSTRITVTSGTKPR